MRPIGWLHISDFHLRVNHAWPQDVVLSAMRDDIMRRRKAGAIFDFILATGDIAHAGKVDEYKLAVAFFDELAAATSVPREKIFCIPGNHDIDRDRQKMSFAGARLKLQSENDVYSFLASGDDLETLLKRQENYRTFQKTYFAGQERTQTADGLGYVSLIEVDDIRVAIVGLDSAWLADGGLSDHGRLLLGEQQVMDALRTARAATPHIVIATAHHPFQLLQIFDGRLTQRRIEDECHFFHCGHLHESEARDVVRLGSRCVTLAAGSSFESRDSHNAYSVVTIDLLRARCAIKFVQYKPTQGAFSYESNESYPLEIDATDLCGVGQLAQAIQSYHPPLVAVAHYLSALLLEAQSEVPIPAGGTFVFGSLDLLEGQPDSDIKVTTAGFMTVTNALKLFSGRKPIAEILTRHGEPVIRYGKMLDALCKVDAGLRARLAEREHNARVLAATEPLRPFAHTMALLDKLLVEEDWEALREQARRHAGSTDAATAAKARRMLAFSLGRSTERLDREQAVSIYRELTLSTEAKADDIAALATLLSELGDHNGAKAEILGGIERFPDSADGFAAIGQTIVGATGDRDFREKLNARRIGRKTA
jgi:predicted phosphodiesterase